MRILLDNDAKKIYVQEAQNQIVALELANERFPNAKEIIGRRIYNPSIDHEYGEEVAE